MDEARRAALKARGWVETDVSEVFGLDEVDRQVVEFRVRLAREMKRRRLESKLTEAELAERIGVDQPRIPAIETGMPGVSLEIMMEAFFTLGGKIEDLARTV
jgi:DNA-binding XRE family transcriptional regulator